MALTDAMMCALATNWGLVNISLRDVTQCTQHHTISGVALYTLRKSVNGSKQHMPFVQVRPGALFASVTHASYHSRMPHLTYTPAKSCLQIQEGIFYGTVTACNSDLLQL